MISVIIPIYNEETVLSQNQEYFTKLSTEVELIFVDGGSEDDSVRCAVPFGEVISTKKGRPSQMNAGARLAKHDILLFLHVDAYLPLNTLRRIVSAIEQGYIGGCLYQVIDRPEWIFKWIAWTGNVRAKMLKIFYGDQGIFVRRDIFETLGGFPEEVPICEDILFSKRLREQGQVGILSEPIYSSARRWVDQGIAKTFLLNMRITTSLLLGRDLNRFADKYKDIR